MESRIKINEKITVGIEESGGKTCITVYDHANGRTVLSDIETDEYFTSDFKYNEYYIVAYSKGCMANQIPLSIDGAYSIKDKRKLELSPKLKELLENMLVTKRCFGLDHVLEAISEDYLQLLDLDDTSELPDYLSAGMFSNIKCARYILQCYPELTPYSRLQGPISFAKYKQIKKELGKGNFFFHIMPQDLLKIPGLTGEI